MEIKNFRQAKENTLALRRTHLQSVQAERNTRVLTEVQAPKDIADLCVMPVID